jgi:hypothetical protein
VQSTARSAGAARISVALSETSGGEGQWLEAAVEERPTFATIQLEVQLCTPQHKGQVERKSEFPTAPCTTSKDVNFASSRTIDARGESRIPRRSYCLGNACHTWSAEVPAWPLIEGRPGHRRVRRPGDGDRRPAAGRRLVPSMITASAALSRGAVEQAAGSGAK